jgi:hypothetical protein
MEIVTETFTDQQVRFAIESFLEFGENSYGIAHKGYYSNGGWAARCLKFHLAQIDPTTPNRVQTRAPEGQE